MSSKPKRPVQPTDVIWEVMLVYHISEEEDGKGIAALKNGKVAGIDDVLVKQILNRKKNKVPILWRQSMINAILKPYKPISLLCYMYKLYEILIFK